MPFSSDGMTFTISRATAFNNGYTKAFTEETWAMLVILIACVALAMAAVVKWGQEPKQAEFKLEQCFIYTAQNYCGFGAKRWHVTPIDIPSRYIIN